MKHTRLLTAVLFTTATGFAQAQSFDLSSTLNKAKETVTQSKNVTDLTNQLTTASLISMASEKIGVSPQTTQAGIGALLNVAKQQLGKGDFSTVADALPEAKTLMKAAPKMDTSAVTSLFGKTDEKAQTAASLGYLDSTFKELGIPKESLLPLANMLTGYLEQSGYGQAAGLLKQGLNFL